MCLYFMLTDVEYQRLCAGYETSSGAAGSSVLSCLALLTQQYEVNSVVSWVFVNTSYVR